MPKARDPRWILLTESGEYSTLGRHREPGTEDIAAAETSLTRAGLAGWIAVMSDSTYSRTMPELVMVRPLCGPCASFDAAVEAFRRKVTELRRG